MISHPYKTIFIHTPKCAGSSAKELLRSIESFDTIVYPPKITEWAPFRYYRRMIMHAFREKGIKAAFRIAFQYLRWLNHPSLRFLRIKYRMTDPLSGERIGAYRLLEKSIPDRLWDEYFKFTIVRNPYERLVSAWSFSVRELKEKNKLVYDFPEFVRAITQNDFAATGQHLTADEMALIEWHVLPMSQHLCNAESELGVDYVAKLENIGEDWAHITNHLGLPKTAIENIRVNTSEHQSFREYYTEGLQQLVYTYYQKDFELFGYSRSSYKLL